MIGRAIVVGALCWAAASAHAALMRCPAPFGEGTVITNVMRDSDAAERGCEPLQARRSTLDVEPPAATARSAGSFADRWTAPRHAPAPRRREAAAPHNQPDPRAVRELRDMAAAAAPAAAQRDSGAVASAAPWRVPAQLQRVRDTDRRGVLEQELAQENRAIAAARERAQALPAGSAQRAQADEALTRHLTNAEALQRELARVARG